MRQYLYKDLSALVVVGIVLVIAAIGARGAFRPPTAAEPIARSVHDYSLDGVKPDMWPFEVRGQLGPPDQIYAVDRRPVWIWSKGRTTARKVYFTSGEPVVCGVIGDNLKNGHTSVLSVGDPIEKFLCQINKVKIKYKDGCYMHHPSPNEGLAVYPRDGHVATLYLGPRWAVP